MTMLNDIRAAIQSLKGVKYGEEDPKKIWGTLLGGGSGGGGGDGDTGGGGGSGSGGGSGGGGGGGGTGSGGGSGGGGTTPDPDDGPPDDGGGGGGTIPDPIPGPEIPFSAMLRSLVPSSVAPTSRRDRSGVTRRSDL